VRLWDIDPKAAKQQVGKEPTILSKDGEAVRALAFLPTRPPFLVAGGDDRRLRVWDVSSGKLLMSLAGHSAPIRGVTFWPGSGGHVISSGADRTLRVWDLETQKEVATLRGHVNVVSSVASGGEQPFCVSGGWDGLVKLWNPQADIATERFTLSGHTGPVQAVAMSGDRRTIASAGRDGTVRLWRAAPEGPAFQHPRGEQ
jgi:WD40 repeat protein